ncbi:MAG: Fic family protein, partial [Deinococcus sp.]|nr:Fic family protein [Deinococcus sp.]
WRSGEHGPMQVVSGPLGRERVHFEAPDAARVPQEMESFLAWLEREPDLDPLIKAGLAHFRFVTVHPFEDGNGRIARALTELLLTRADRSAYRYYSLSRQIEQDRKGYYDVLERTQASQHMDVTPWLEWFLQKLDLALQEAERQQEEVRLRQAYWQRRSRDALNARQLKVLELLLGGDFQGKLRTAKYASLTKVSPATAQRDLQELVEGGYLVSVGAGRSTAYELAGAA